MLSRFRLKIIRDDGMSSDLSDAYSNIKPIDSNCTGFNYAESTIPLGFKPEWSLGGDSGHYDFIHWLDGYLSYSNHNLYLAVYGAFLMAQDDAKQAYQPCVLYALKLFFDMGHPELYLLGTCDEYYEKIEEHCHNDKEKIDAANKLVSESDPDYLDFAKSITLLSNK